MFDYRRVNGDIAGSSLSKIGIEVDVNGLKWGTNLGCQTDVIPETKVTPWPAQWAGYHFDF